MIKNLSLSDFICVKFLEEKMIATSPIHKFLQLKLVLKIVKRKKKLF